MRNSYSAILGAQIFDGERLLDDAALLISGGCIVTICASSEIPDDARRMDMNGGIIAPGFVDLQVNGGGGVLFNDEQSVTTLKTISRAHAALGTLSFLPTLITDTPARTTAAIAAVTQAIRAGVPGILGLHLEGPHLSVARKGAHDRALIRPMQDADLDELLRAAKSLPHLMVTVAPEAVTMTQIEALARAGSVVSLGHTDASYEACTKAAAAGAHCTTHLFNAMSQLQGRAPGLVGAALDTPAMFAGLIADGIHVHPASIRAARAAKKAPGALFLVTDAMATAGSDMQEFSLNGRKIYRRGGRLTLGDGTLAGADLDMARALRVMVGDVGVSARDALAMATSIPARLLGAPRGLGRLCSGCPADFVHLATDFSLQSCWRRGVML